VSEAIFAVTRHVPEVVALIVAVFVALDKAQAVAVPPEVIAYVFAPVPLLPDVVIERAWEYGAVFEEVPNDVIEIVWFALPTVTVTGVGVTALSL
jgi:hypothetical protein